MAFNTISKERLAELSLLLKKQSAPSIPEPETKTIKDDIQDALVSESIPTIPIKESTNEITDKYGKAITYNDKQKRFVDLVSDGKSCVLIGAAGTGKTTTQKGCVQSLIFNGRAGILQAEGHKHLSSGTPGIVVCAYTRRAVANIRRNMPLDMQANCITIHKLLEYQPAYYDVIDETTGEEKTKMCFEATRHAGNPLPESIHTIIFEEGSMLGTDLYKEVKNACPHQPQEIFLGDIQQLPPVFGPAILGFKLLELPVVELTEVYRQALESPIISLAHRILSGNPIEVKEFPAWKFKDKLTLHPWKKKIKDFEALSTAITFFTQASDHQIYDPEEDIILCPFNKAFGTIELNNGIANHLAKKRGSIVWQIIAGFNKYHFSEGDKVLFDKEDATIIEIEKNLSYTGAAPKKESIHLDYWGFNSSPEESKSDGDDHDIDFILNQVAASESKNGEDRVRACSHVLTLKMNDSDQEIKTDKASDINSLILGYALTVHKAQGSEWKKVFCVFHQSHATMIQRELLYTAITRAREELYIICEPDTFVNGIISQRVKGNTLEEKASYFKGRLEKINDGPQ